MGRQKKLYLVRPAGLSQGTLSQKKIRAGQKYPIGPVPKGGLLTPFTEIGEHAILFSKKTLQLLICLAIKRFLIHHLALNLIDNSTDARRDLRHFHQSCVEVGVNFASQLFVFQIKSCARRIFRGKTGSAGNVLRERKGLFGGPTSISQSLLFYPPPRSNVPVGILPGDCPLDLFARLRFPVDPISQIRMEVASDASRE